MSEVISPTQNPELAAQQVVLALIEAKVFGQNREHGVVTADQGKTLSEAITKTHEQLTAFYRTLPGAQ